MAGGLFVRIGDTQIRNSVGSLQTRSSTRRDPGQARRDSCTARPRALHPLVAPIPAKVRGPESGPLAVQSFDALQVALGDGAGRAFPTPWRTEGGPR